jgi:hypothetical protein
MSKNIYQSRHQFFCVCYLPLSIFFILLFFFWCKSQKDTRRFPIMYTYVYYETLYKPTFTFSRLSTVMVTSSQDSLWRVNPYTLCDEAMCFMGEMANE